MYDPVNLWAAKILSAWAPGHLLSMVGAEAHAVCSSLHGHRGMWCFRAYVFT